jgi:hypothetical protein
MPLLLVPKPMNLNQLIARLQCLLLGHFFKQGEPLELSRFGILYKCPRCNEIAVLNSAFKPSAK